MDWGYPSFAYFWDNDREYLMKLGYDKLIERLSKLGINPEDIGDIAHYPNDLVCIRTRNDRKLFLRLGETDD